MAKGIKIHERQSLWNLALQHYGSADGITKLFDAGVFTGFNSVPVVGAKIVPGTAINKSVVDYYIDKGIVVATATTTSGGEYYNEDYSNDDYNTN